MGWCRRAVLAAIAGVASPQSALSQQYGPEVTRLSIKANRRTADFDDMLRRGVIRMLVPHSRTLFFQDRGRIFGITAEQAAAFEARFHRIYRTSVRALTITLIPTSRDRLIPGLLAGEGDIAAGNITVTEERKALVSFVDSPFRDIKEIIVTGKDAPPVPNAEALSGREVAVSATTSYFASLIGAECEAGGGSQAAGDRASGA